MFESIMNFFKKMTKKEDQTLKSKDAAKERLHLVLMQDRANVSADFLDLMKQEIIEVIKKYIDIDEKAIDVRLTNKENSDGTNGAPALYANIPILNIKDEARKNAKVIESNKEEENEKENVVEKVVEETSQENDTEKTEQEEVKEEENVEQEENTTKESKEEKEPSEKKVEDKEEVKKE